MRQPNSLRTAELVLCSAVVVGCSNPSDTAGSARESTPANAPTSVQKLNLSRDLVNEITYETNGDPLDAPKLLPKLIDEDTQAKRVSVNGKLLTDKEALELADKVEGVEFKVEIKTQ